jgi:DNA-binding NarL/FixJ family response regulator
MNDQSIPISIPLPVTTALVVEDDLFFQSVITEALSACSVSVTPALVSSAQEAIAFLEDNHALTSLALIDLCLPDMHGVALIRQIRQKWPKVVCIVVSGSQSRESVMPAIEAGAVGYVVKGDPHLSIGDAISLVREGLNPISPELTSFFVELVQNRKSERIKTALGLTRRECELLEHFSRGESYKRAAIHMGVGVSTIQTHTRNLYRKLGARSSLQAVMRAKAEGLL